MIERIIKIPCLFYEQTGDFYLCDEYDTNTESTHYFIPH